MEWKSHYSLLHHCHDMLRSFPSTCRSSLWVFIRWTREADDATSSHVNKGEKICWDERCINSETKNETSCLLPKDFALLFPTDEFMPETTFEWRTQEKCKVWSETNRTRQIRFPIHSIPLKWFPFAPFCRRMCFSEIYIFFCHCFWSECSFCFPLIPSLNFRRRH